MPQKESVFKGFLEKEVGAFFDYFNFLDMKIFIPPIFSWGNWYNEKQVVKSHALSLKFSLICQKAIHSLTENKPLNLGSKYIFDKVVAAFNKSILL